MLEKFTEEEVNTIEKEVFAKYKLPFKVCPSAINSDLINKLSDRFTFGQKFEDDNEYDLRKRIGRTVARSCIDIVNFTLHNYDQSEYKYKYALKEIELSKMEDYKNMINDLFDIVDRYCI